MHGTTVEALRLERDAFISLVQAHPELREVGFRYGGPESPAIQQGITLEIPHGRTCAIVGRSGSSKTTLLELIAGLLDATEGAVRFNRVLQVAQLANAHEFIQRLPLGYETRSGEPLDHPSAILPVDPPPASGNSRRTSAHSRNAFAASRRPTPPHLRSRTPKSRRANASSASATGTELGHLARVGMGGKGRVLVGRQTLLERARERLRSD